MHPASRRWLVALLPIAAACGRGSAPAADTSAAAGRGTTATALAGPTRAADTLRLPAPAESSLGSDPVSRSIRRGLALVTATRDSLPDHVGADLRCVSCHLDGGRRAFAMPWVGVYGRFPQYRSRSARVIRLEERINDCIRRSLNGTALAVEGDDMRDIVSYISWLSRGTASGARLRGAGIDSLVPLAFDTTRGRAAYGPYCARCHGPAGEGMLRRGLPNAGPPLWGPRSFNIGSGMARVRVMAAFVHRHMPFDMPGTVSAQMAFDVAAFTGSRPRPDFAGKERDWPEGDAPVDGAYRTRGRDR